MCEVICWLFKSQIVLVFGQHLVSYVPGKFLHKTIMNLYKDIKEIQQGKMVSTKIKMIDSSVITVSNCQLTMNFLNELCL